MRTFPNISALLVLLMSGIVFPITAAAKLPSAEFAAKRLSATRDSKKATASVSLFRKSPEEFTGAMTTCSDQAFKLGKLEIKKTTTDIGVRLLWIAFSSKTVFTDVTKLLGPIDPASQTVEVVGETIAVRYGSSPSVLVSLETGELVGLTVKNSTGDWKLVVVKDGKKRRGSVLRSGVIYARFSYEEK